MNVLQRHCRVDCRPTSWVHDARVFEGAQPADPVVDRANSLPRGDCSSVEACKSGERGSAHQKWLTSWLPVPMAA